MKRLIAGCLLALAAAAASAQDAEKSIDQMISDAVAPIINPFVGFIFSPLFGSEALLGTGFPWIVLWLVVAAIVFTLYFGFMFWIDIDWAYETLFPEFAIVLK